MALKLPLSSPIIMGWLALLEHFSMKAAKLRKRGMPKGMKCRYCQEIFRITFCGLLIACERVCATLFFQNILSVHVQIENCTRFRMALTPKTCYFFVCRVPRCQPLPLVSWKATPSLARTYLWNPCVGDSSRFSGKGGFGVGKRTSTRPTTSWEHFFRLWCFCHMLATSYMLVWPSDKCS